MRTIGLDKNKHEKEIKCPSCGVKIGYDEKETMTSHRFVIDNKLLGTQFNGQRREKYKHIPRCPNCRQKIVIEILD